MILRNKFLIQSSFTYRLIILEKHIVFYDICKTQTRQIFKESKKQKQNDVAAQSTINKDVLLIMKILGWEMLLKITMVSLTMLL